MVDDKTLIEKLKDGDQAALECIYVKYRPKLMATAYYYHVDQHQAEDVLHDVFLSFTHRSREIEINRSLYAYLRAGILNGVRDIIRQRSRQDSALNNQSTSGDSLDCPCKQLIEMEETIQAEDLLSILPDSQREVVCMRLHAGLKFQDIACIQGVSSSTVRGRYRYGISRLRELSNID